ncbi:enterochelin esterase domain-containing protein [Nocardioides sp.]|uniref:enterochelin esterase domain-containing protein n=1 Tax=Nocardioides sp. TaxID=35761 RepID=UPI00260A2A2B|nr:enterochelin esterase domain-containing protein [Nocardioides sp.]
MRPAGGAETPARRRPPKRPRPSPVPRVASPLIAGLGEAPADLERFWDDVARVAPLIQVHEPGADGEQTMTVTFVWRDTDGDAEQVLLFANRLTDETSLAQTLLDHVPGTDLWHASFTMGADWRASYSFLVHRRGEPAPWVVGDQVAIRAALDRGRPDPLNPLTCRNRAGVEQSVVEGPAAPAQPWLIERGGIARGTLDRGEGPGGRTLWLYDPPGTAPDAALPLLVVLDGEVWVGPQSLPTTLDNLIADGLAPVRAVLVDSGGREARWADLSVDGTGASYVVDELLDWVRARRGVVPGPTGVAVAGQSLGGLTALRLGLSRPDAVGTVISHSASLWQDDLTHLLAVPTPGRDRVRVFLSHGSQEWVLDPPHRALATRLAEAGITTEVSVHNGGHDYAWWRGGVADAIAWSARLPG